MDRFHSLRDNHLLEILTHCTDIESLAVMNCNLREPFVNVDRHRKITRLDFSYCRYLTRVRGLLARKKGTRVDITRLVLRGTSIDDDALRLMVKELPSLTHLCVRECKKLQAPVIHSDSLRNLAMNFCTKCKAPTLQCPSLEILDLSFTRITDENLERCVFMQRGSINLRVLRLSGCRKLKRPSIVCRERKIPAERVSTSGFQMNNYSSVKKLINKVDEMEENARNVRTFVSCGKLEELYLDACFSLRSVVVHCPDTLRILNLSLSGSSGRRSDQDEEPPTNDNDASVSQAGVWMLDKIYKEHPHLEYLKYGDIEDFISQQKVQQQRHTIPDTPEHDDQLEQILRNEDLDTGEIDAISNED